MKEKFKLGWYLFIIILFCVNCIAIAQLLLFPNTTLEFFGYKPFVAVNDANTTGIDKGDFIIAKTKNNDYEKDDIIIRKKEYLSYKVLGIDEGKFYLRNDFNESLEDVDSSIEGKEVLHLKNVGKIIFFLQNPLTIVLIVCIIVMIAIIRYRLALKELAEDDEDEDKLIKSFIIFVLCAITILIAVILFLRFIGRIEEYDENSKFSVFNTNNTVKDKNKKDEQKVVEDGDSIIFSDDNIYIGKPNNNENVNVDESNNNTNDSDSDNDDFDFSFEFKLPEGEPVKKPIILKRPNKVKEPTIPVDKIDPLEEPEEPDEKPEDFLIMDENDVIWDDDCMLDIFNTSKYGTTNLIAPGYSNTYTFYMKNRMSNDFNYIIRFTEENEVGIDMMYKLKRNGEYLYGDENTWVYYDELDLENDILSDTEDKYELEWKWMESTDEIDTDFGVNHAGEIYQLGIKIIITQIGDLEDDEEDENLESEEDTENTEEEETENTENTSNENTTNSSNTVNTTNTVNETNTTNTTNTITNTVE